MKEQKTLRNRAPLSKVISYVILTFWAVTTA